MKSLNVAVLICCFAVMGVFSQGLPGYVGCEYKAIIPMSLKAGQEYVATRGGDFETPQAKKDLNFMDTSWSKELGGSPGAIEITSQGNYRLKVYSQDGRLLKDLISRHV
jgi:hypothetical protein